MSKTTKPPSRTNGGGSAAARKQDTRAKAAAMRAAQQAQDRRRRNVITAITVAIVLVLVVGVGIAIQANRNKAATTAGGTPSGFTTDYGIVVGDAAPVQVTAYEDFQCPICANFEKTTGPALAQMVADGTVQVTYQPMAFLDSSATDDYSTRALNAAACVVNSDPDAFQAYHDALFANQSPEEGPGNTDEMLTQMASEAGATDPSVGTCISNLTYEGWTKLATEAASKARVTAAPTIKVDGKEVTDPTVADLQAAVAAAQSASSSTPSTSSTP